MRRIAVYAAFLTGAVASVTPVGQELRASPPDQPNWDTRITLSANTIESPFVSGSSRVLSSMLTPSALVLPPALILWGHAVETENPTSAREISAAGVRAGLSALTTHLLGQLLKSIVDRPRPFRRPDLGFVSRAEEEGASFPSGHASVSAAIAASLSLSEPRVWVVVPSVLWSCAISFSRMHLGVHYFTDVIAGTVLGVVVAAVWHGLRDRVSQASDGILPEASRVTAVPRQVTLVRFKFPLFPASAITVDGSP